MSFYDSPKYLYTSESVTEGHPDKVCDQVSDAVLDAFLTQDPYSRVACETCATDELVVVMGEITSQGKVDVEKLVRQTLREIGYTDRDLGIGCDTAEVRVALHQQSPEISNAVTRNSVDDPARTGAGDQGMMVGFACKEFVGNRLVDTELMPLTIYLSQQLARRMALVRKEGIMPYLRPDGKSQVTVEYQNGKPKRVHTVVMSVQHDAGVSQDQLRRDLIQNVLQPVIPSILLDKETIIHTNPGESWTFGGPAADTGLTGRKILVDTYGGVARHGGGAFSGKDPTKVDRSGAYAARYVAKNIVAAGLADRCEVQVSYAIGYPEPISVSVETFGSGHVSDNIIDKLVAKHFDLRPGAIIRGLELRRPIYRGTASYGHFGRADLDLPWERTDKAEALRKEALALTKKSSVTTKQATPAARKAVAKSDRKVDAKTAVKLVKKAATRTVAKASGRLAARVAARTNGKTHAPAKSTRKGTARSARSTRGRR
ncbi:MAG: methionine adenosyltransferase [Dehalococcoidia bacterium]|nr:methionine adenosyltransferase [Dehalococcoidia bacterium]